MYIENDLALDTESGNKILLIKDQCAKCDIEILYTKVILGKQGHGYENKKRARKAKQIA